MSEYFPPQYHSTNFHCAHCHVYASQHWRHVISYDKSNRSDHRLVSIDQVELEVSLCSHCRQPTFWLREQIIFPFVHTSPPANSDLPDNARKKFMKKQLP